MVPTSIEIWGTTRTIYLQQWRDMNSTPHMRVSQICIMSGRLALIFEQVISYYKKRNGVKCYEEGGGI